MELCWKWLLSIHALVSWLYLLSTFCPWASMLRELTQTYSILSVGYPWCYSSLQAWNSFAPSIWLVAFWRALLSKANVLRFFHHLEAIYNKYNDSLTSHPWFDFIPTLENTEGYTPKENFDIDTWVTVIQKRF